jgi:transposase
MYFVGIGVGKRYHQAVIVDEQGKHCGDPLGFSNTRPGIDSLVEKLEELGESVRAALESSAQYWLCLYDQLTSCGYDVAVINPLQINAYRKTGIRKVKTDPIDAFWIADLLRINQVRPNQIPEAVRL